MEIKYTYRDEDRPIEAADVATSFGDDMSIEIDDCAEVRISMVLKPRIDFSRDDWKNFCTLVNRINQQINGGA